MKNLLIFLFVVFSSANSFGMGERELKNLKCVLDPSYQNNETKMFESDYYPSIKSTFSLNPKSENFIAQIDQKIDSFIIKATAINNSIVEIYIKETVSDESLLYTGHMQSKFSQSSPPIFLTLTNTKEKQAQQSLTNKRTFLSARLMCLIVYK